MKQIKTVDAVGQVLCPVEPRIFQCCAQRLVAFEIVGHGTSNGSIDILRR